MRRLLAMELELEVTEVGVERDALVLLLSLACRVSFCCGGCCFVAFACCVLGLGGVEGVLWRSGATKGSGRQRRRQQ